MDVGIGREIKIGAWGTNGFRDCSGRDIILGFVEPLGYGSFFDGVDRN